MRNASHKQYFVGGPRHGDDLVGVLGDARFTGNTIRPLRRDADGDLAPAECPRYHKRRVWVADTLWTVWVEESLTESRALSLLREIILTPHTVANAYDV